MAATITWFGHSTVRLVLADDRVVIVDPYLADNPACPDEFKKPDRCDMIFLTHGHFDHIGGVADLIDAFNPIIVGNFELCAALQKTLDKGNYSPMNTGGTQKVEGVNVSLTPALHSSSIDTPAGPMYAGMPNGLVIEAPSLAKVYHAGDTDVFSEMEFIQRRYQPEICILPMGGYFTMDAQGAALAVEMLKPKCILPIHFKTFPVLAQSTDEFEAALPSELKRRLVKMEAGVALPWTTNGLG